MLFVPASTATFAECRAAECFSDTEQLDLVLIDATPGGGSDCFTLGFDLLGSRVWRFNYLLWRPDGPGPACFVPPLRSEETFYRIERGRLFSVEGRPWCNRADRERGFEAAQVGLRRLVEGR